MPEDTVYGDQRGEKQRMIKDIVIAIVQRITQIRVMRRANSRFRWCLIQLYTWPVEIIQRRQRRQVLIEYIDRLRAMGEEKRDDVQCM